MSRSNTFLPILGLFSLVASAAIAADRPSDVLSDFGGVRVERPAERPVEAAIRTGGTASADATKARERGVTWLKQHQKTDGGWSSGAHGTTGAEAQSDVATTAFAVLALMRDANGTDAHRDAVTKGTLFVVKAVETAPEGPRLNTPEGTQIQYKLGQLVDTHMASMMLGEVAGKLDKETDRRVQNALDKVIGKVMAAQNADGSFDANGWAPVLSSSIASQGLTRAAELGRKVDEDVLAKADKYNSGLAGESGFDASSGAGVQLYAVASALRGAANTQSRDGAVAAAPAEAKRAKEAEGRAQAAVTGDSGALMAGFGSIGGEEMLSYMMISDTLAEKGDKAWTDWEGRVGAFLVGQQNADGSWTGHHCITSQAFTTAGGIMTLASGIHADQGRNG